MEKKRIARRPVVIELAESANTADVFVSPVTFSRIQVGSKIDFDADDEAALSLEVVRKSESKRRRPDEERTVQKRTPVLPFGIVRIEKSNTVLRVLPVVGERGCEISNPQQRKLFDALIKSDGKLRATAVREMFPNRGKNRNYRANVIRRLCDKLEEIQLTVKCADGFYSIKDFSE